MEQHTALSGSRKDAHSSRVMPGMCGICPAGCGVNIHLVDGKIDRLTPLKDHPQGIVCPRGARAKEIVYSPDRLLYPQRKNRFHGSGEFQRITWDQAYDMLVKNLHRLAESYGPESICVYTGRGNFEFGLNELFAPAETVESSANAVLFPFGSPNTTGVGALCYASYGMIASRACFGEYMRHMHEDILGADLILVWGANPTTDSSPINLTTIKRAQREGARVVVIDHRLSETAQATRGEWIGIRPGTDGALALAAIHVLIEEDLYDRDFVGNWTHGFDELRNYVADFTPERVQSITWVPADRIRQLARELAAAKGCSIVTYTGLEYSNSGVQAIRAVWTLQALAGHMDVPGGKLFNMPNRLLLNRHLTPPPINGRKPIGAQEYPIYYQVRNEAHAALLPKAVLEGEPYPIRGMIIAGSSLLTAWPNPDLWRRVLASLDFLAVIDRFPTADSHYADLRLPATTYFENDSYMIYDGYIQFRQRVIEPRGKARSDYLIFAELARKLGYGDLWPQTEDQMVRYALQGTGFDLETLKDHPEGLPFHIPEMRYRKYASGELRADGRPGFETLTGKFEIASEWLRSYGYDALPVYTEPVEGPMAAPELAEKFPLVLNTGARTQSAFRSQHHNIPSLVAMQPAPRVHLHPDDARERGIKDGGEVELITARGRVPFRAQVSRNVLKGVVEANMGGGGVLGPDAWRRANVNVLTDFENRDPISGFPVYKALLCDVVKARS